MIVVDVQIEGTKVAAALFKRKQRYIADFAQIDGRRMMDVVKDDIQDEIRGQHYLAGGRSRWPQTVPIGDLAGGRPALQSYSRRWAGATPVVRGNTVEIRMTAPGAGAHAGGHETTRSETVTAIRPRGEPRAMQGAIIRSTGGGFVSRRTLTGPGLQLPSRPHANPDNPTTIPKVERVMEQGLERA